LTEYKPSNFLIVLVCVSPEENVFDCFSVVKLVRQPLYIVTHLFFAQLLPTAVQAQQCDLKITSLPASTSEDMKCKQICKHVTTLLRLHFVRACGFPDVCSV
jgi:hypothetical protein